MREILVNVAGPFVVLLVVFTVTSPFALVFHTLIALIKRRIGSLAAIVVYGVEVLGAFLWLRWILDPISAVFEAGLYDGPGGFGAGMFSGFIMIFAGMLVILNGVGLCRLLREARQRR